jgi:hypothetical protein
MVVRIVVTEKLLDRSDVVASFQQMCGKRMAKRVTADRFAESRGARDGSDRALQRGLV